MPLARDLAAPLALIDSAGYAPMGEGTVQREFAGLPHGFYGLELFSPAVVEAMNWTSARLKELIG